MKVFCCGKLIGEFQSDDELLNFMNKEGYWPNTWTLSDHGNLSFRHLPGLKYGHPEYRCDCEVEFDHETDYVIEE